MMAWRSFGSMWRSSWRAVFGDVVGAGQAEVGVGDDLGFGVEMAADPADPNGVDGFDTTDVVEGVFDPFDESGIDAVHQPVIDVPDGAA